MTASVFRSPATVVWAGLVFATCVSWTLGSRHGGNAELATLIVLAVTFTKVRFVGAFFMELRGAPRAIRFIFDGWCGAALVLLSSMYLLG